MDFRSLCKEAYWNSQRLEGEELLDTKKRVFKAWPKADGVMKYWHRLIEEAFNHIHAICVQNNIDAFLMGGSLIGALRHNYIIPWDTDGDVGIFRKDLESFKAAMANDDMFEWRETVAATRVTRRIALKNGGASLIDVFVWDGVKSSASKENTWELRTQIKNNFAAEKTKEVKNYLKIEGPLSNFTLLSNSLASIPELKNKIESDYKAFISAQKNYVENIEEADYVMWGIDMNATTSSRINTKNEALPFKEVDFCGKKWKSFNNPESMLAQEGCTDLWDFPNSIKGTSSIKSLLIVNKAAFEKFLTPEELTEFNQVIL